MTTTAVEPAKPRAGEHSRNALLTGLVFLIALALGWLYKGSVEGRSLVFRAPDGSFTLSYPAAWASEGPTGENVLLEAFHLHSDSSFHPFLRVERRNLAEEQTLIEAAAALSLNRSRNLTGYRQLESQDTSLGGQSAIRIEYGYIADLPAGTGQAVLPVVVHAADWLVAHNEGLLVLTLASDALEWEEMQPIFDRILNSVRLQ